MTVHSFSTQYNTTVLNTTISPLTSTQPSQLRCCLLEEKGLSELWRDRSLITEQTADSLFSSYIRNNICYQCSSLLRNLKCHQTNNLQISSQRLLHTTQCLKIHYTHCHKTTKPQLDCTELQLVLSRHHIDLNDLTPS